MQSLIRDLRYGLRILRTQPMFAVIANLTLALAIGANTAVFTVVDAALLRPLPYSDPERLVHLWETNQQDATRQREASYPDYLDLKGHSELFEGVLGYNGRNVTLDHRGLKERRQAARVTANFFSLLGVEPLLGRTFFGEEDRAGAQPLVVLSHGLWQRRFGGDPELIGQSLNLNGTDYIVIGILPPQFRFAPIDDAELWIPLNPSVNEISRRFMHWLGVIARLKPGVSLEQAKSGMDSIARQLEDADPQYHRGAMIRVVLLRDQIVGSVKPLLLVLLAAVAFVMLIACANIANLLLVRATARRKEFSIRSALGASRLRLIRQLLTESALLSFLGGALGLLLAQWGIQLLSISTPPSQLSFRHGLAIDWRAVAFTGLLSLLTSVVFGLVPAFEASKLDLQRSLKEGGRTSGRGSHRLRNSLIVSEVALALVLLIGAGLMMRSLLRLMQVDPGFDPQNLLTFQLSLPADRYGGGARAAIFYQELLTRVESLPGVKAAGAVNRLPLGGGSTGSFVVDGRAAATPGQEPVANVRTVSIGYFRSMGLPLIAGRSFTEYDKLGSPSVLMINERVADRFFPGENPVGQRIRFAFAGNQPLEIVGVIGDEKVVPLDTETTPVVYFPHLQNTDLSMNLVARTSIDPLQMSDAVRDEVRALDPDLLVYHIESMDHYISRLPSVVTRRYPAVLIGIFAGVALTLAVIGIYGIISYTISQRMHELAIRIALGASRLDIGRLVVGQGLALTMLGIVAGLIAASVLTRFIQSLLFGVSIADLVTFIGVPGLLLAVATIACVLPVRRATKVDPMTALRHE